MRPGRVVIPREFAQHGPKMLFMQDDQMIQALSAECSDDAFRDCVRPRRPDGRGDGIDADPSGSLAEVTSVDRIAITQQMAGFLTPGRRLDELTPHPGGGRVGGHVDMHQLRRPCAMNTSTYNVLNVNVGTVNRSAAHRWWA